MPVSLGALEMRPEHGTPSARETPGGFSPSSFVYEVGSGDLNHELRVDIRLSRLCLNDLLNGGVELGRPHIRPRPPSQCRSLRHHGVDQRGHSIRRVLLEEVVKCTLRLSQ